ncbi:MAG: MFS transporter [Rhodospirillaceae bacterium]|nr:MFS transporter [Rhodospirillaceae bacterium]
MLPIILQSPNSTMAADLGLTPQDGGRLAGYLGMAWGISAFVMGYLADKVGRRAVLVPAILVFSLMSAFSGLAGSVMALIIFRIIMGVAEGPVASTGVAVAVEASKPERRGMNNGIFQCMISLFGLALAPLIATRLLDSYDWRVVFMLVGAPGVILAIVMWYVVREPLKRAYTGHGAGGGTPFLSMFGHRNAKVAPLTLICAMGGIFVIAAMLTAYLTAPVGAGLGLDPVTAGNVFSAVGIGGCIGQFAMPALSDFIGRKLSTLASYILAAVFLYFFTQAGPDNTPPRCGSSCSSPRCSILRHWRSLAGPVAAEAAPPGMLASMAGFVIFAGEFVGGGAAPIIAGNIASNPAYGLKGALYSPPAACGSVSSWRCS